VKSVIYEILRYVVFLILDLPSLVSKYSVRREYLNVKEGERER